MIIRMSNQSDYLRTTVMYNVREIHGLGKVLYRVVHVSSEGKPVSLRLFGVFHLQYLMVRKQLNRHRQSWSRAETMNGKRFRDKGL